MPLLFRAVVQKSRPDKTAFKFYTCTSYILLLTVVLCLQVMLLGDSGVGKTCLLVRFKDNAFLSGNFISTVGIDFRVSFNLNL